MELAEIREAVAGASRSAARGWRDRVTEALLAAYIEHVECAEDAQQSYGAAWALEDAAHSLGIDLPAAVREAEEPASTDPDECAARVLSYSRPRGGMTQPRQCATCGRKPNLRRWRKGLERWLYETIRYPKKTIRRWTCGECFDKES